jgi:hypothetical protein
MPKGNRKLKIEIVVPVEAVNFIEAAGHQGRLHNYFTKIAARYQTSSFRMIERRGRGLHAPSRAASQFSSGKLNEYE